MRQENPKHRKYGFTLAELLIVVAIIGVLVAVSIPIFSNQLEKAREATDLANLRAAKAAAIVAFLSGDLTEGEPGATSEPIECYYDSGTGRLEFDYNLVDTGYGTARNPGDRVFDQSIGLVYDYNVDYTDQRINVYIEPSGFIPGEALSDDYVSVFFDPAEVVFPEPGEIGDPEVEESEEEFEGDEPGGP